MGHEIAGKVDDIGPVLVYASWGCGSCPFCTRGEEQLCEEGEAAGWDRDGGYTEYVRVPSRRYLIPLGDLDPVHPAPLADAGVTPYRVVRLSPPWLQDPGAVLVIGSGGLGQFAIQYLRLLASAHVVAIDPLPDKRKRARALGAHETFALDDPVPAARAVLDFVGSDKSLATALKTVERGGVIAQIGAAGGEVAFGFETVPYEAFLTNSIWGSLGDLRDVVRLAQDGRIEWHVERLPLERAN